MQKLKLQIKSNQVIADRIYKMELLGDFSTNQFLPGQFLHIKCGEGSEHLLRRPISICDITPYSEINPTQQKDLMTIIYRSEGKGTQLLSNMRCDDVVDILSPLGKSYPIHDLNNNHSVLLVGGGVGVPPLYYLAKQIKKQNPEIQINSILGFNSAKDVFLEKEFSELGKCFVSTVDASHGTKGFVTDVLKEHFVIPGSNSSASHWDALYTCGPSPMLKALQDLLPLSACLAENKKTYMSLEERMGCGVGACLACYCEPSIEAQQNPDNEKLVNKGYAKICSDGPVFELHAIKL